MPAAHRRHATRPNPPRAVRTALLAALLTGLLALPAPALADAVGAELLLLTSHVRSQRDAPVDEYDRRLDDRGQHVLTPGIEAYYDNTLEKPLWGAREVRFTGGVLEDSARHTFFYLAVMGRWILAEGERLTLSLDFGPGFMARESWRDIPGYRGDNAFNESDTFLPGYEWLVLPLGEIDLLYRFAPQWEAVYSVFPGIPYVITQSVGLRRSF